MLASSVLLNRTAVCRLDTAVLVRAYFRQSAARIKKADLLFAACVQIGEVPTIRSTPGKRGNRAFLFRAPWGRDTPLFSSPLNSTLLD